MKGLMPTLIEDWSQIHVCSRKAVRESRFSLLILTDPFFLSIPTCIVTGGCHLQEFTTARKPGEEITGERGQEPDGEEGLTESPVLQAQWPWAHGPSTSTPACQHLPSQSPFWNTAFPATSCSHCSHLGRNITACTTTQNTQYPPCGWANVWDLGTAKL